MSTTLARTHDSSGSHWYYVDGRPCYELPKKDGNGMKATTLADARKLNLLPSVTTILRVLAKPALESWKMEQACLAVMTAPRLPDEVLDAFVERVLHTEEQHKQEAAQAADRGIAIHDAVECLVHGKPEEAEPWTLEFAESPYMYMVGQCNKILGTEVILCGQGFAGKTDFIGDCGDYDIIVDWKSSKKLPDKASWPEHVLQLSAYAKAHSMNNSGRPIKTANCYISSITAGLYMFFNNPSWEETYEQGFAPLLKYWQFANQYHPTQ